MKSPGLRLQIVLALVGVMALAFAPLYFAVASLARATLLAAREESARAIGRAVAAHVSDVRARGDRDLARVLASHVGPGGVDAICVYTADGIRVACAGDEREMARISAPVAPMRESITTVRGAAGRALDVVVPNAGGAVIARLRTDESTDRSAPLIRLVGGYMLVFAFAIAFTGYLTLTRLIVRPVEALGLAADKFAAGGRRIDVPRSGARELVELSSSVAQMTSRLVEEEAKLRKKVGELERAQLSLQQAQSQLVRSERLASVGRLSAGLAHEIGNPITAIMGLLELLLAGDLTPDEQRDFLGRMSRETERIHFVLRDLLAFSRPDEATPDSDGAEIADVVQVASEALALARPQRTFKSLTLSLDAPEGPLCAAIAPRRLSQVLVNLVLNAGDAQDGRADGRVTVRARAHGGRVVIEVEDNGPGVSAGVRERIFEPFVTTKEVGKGTGLGLAVCRGIVEASGGTIELDSGYAGGARFVVTLGAPVAAPPSRRG